MSTGTTKPPGLGVPPANRLLRSPKSLATALTVLLGLCAVTHLLAAAAEVNRYVAMESFAEFTGPGWSSQLVSVAIGLVMLATVPTAVVFIIWFHRVRVNAGVYAPGAFRAGAGWAIGVWFVPVVGWFALPCLTALKVWSASASRLPGNLAPASAVPVVAWSGAYGVALMASGGAGWVSRGATTRPEVRDSLLVYVASDLLFAVAAVLAVLFVRRLSAMQTAV
ncbi:DUF4328 domain-containing protein [Streptomyces sp. NPDC054956]